MSHRTALLVRVSSIDQVRKGFGIPDQLARLRSEADAAGETVVDEYIDQARSGTSIQKRSEYQRFLQDARKRRFDRVRVESVDRGHRNDFERRQFEEEMLGLGIRVFYSGEPEQQAPQHRKLQRGIKGVLAEWEADETSQRTYNRHVYRANKGKWRGGVIPYGIQPDDTGWFEPDPRTYPVLVWILEQRADGTGHHVIARQLNAGIVLDGGEATVPPTPALVIYHRKPYLERQDPETGDIIHLDRRVPDARWKAQTVRLICQRTVEGVYAGILLWGRRHNKFDEDSFGNPKKLVRVDTQRPLIETTLLQRVQAVELGVQEFSDAPRLHNRYLLANLIRCGACGRAMHGYTTSKYKSGKCYKYRKYRCAGRCNKPGACTLPILGAEVLEQVVLDMVFGEESPYTPRALLAELGEAAERRRAELASAIAALGEHRAELSQRRDEALDGLLRDRLLSPLLRQALTERAEAALRDLATLETEEQTLRVGLESLGDQSRLVERVLNQPNLDPARWEEAAVNMALQRALRLIVQKIEVSREGPRNYTVSIWLLKAENLLFSAFSKSESSRDIFDTTRFQPLRLREAA